jgi:MFS family permease
LQKIGWKWTMIIGILGHAARFLIFAFFGSEEFQWLIIAVQVLHGICYAFFFATLYIFVDAVFPKDIRTSAQGLFNLLVLGIGLVVANFWLGSLARHWLLPSGAVDYHRVFLVPSGLAAAATILLLFFFRPPTRTPEEQTGPVGAAH